MTMKKSVLYLLAAVATMTLAACSNDDNANVPDGATPIQLQASLLSINTRAAQNIQNEQFEKDEELNIYIHEIVPAGSKNGASYSTLPYQYKVTDPETGALKARPTIPSTRTMYPSRRSIPTRYRMSTDSGSKWHTINTLKPTTRPAT